MTGSIVIGVRRGRGPAADASRGSDPGDGGLPIEAVHGHIRGESLLAQPYDEGDPLRGGHRGQLFALFLRHGLSHSAAHVASIRQRSRPPRALVIHVRQQPSLLSYAKSNAPIGGRCRRCLQPLVGPCLDGMIYGHTTMPKAKVALTLDAALLDRVDELVARHRFKNRSQAVESALAEKLARLARTRLAEECAKLDPAEERRLADEGMAATAESWPEY